MIIKKNILHSVFGVIVISAVGLFFTRTLLNNWENIRGIEVSIFPEAFTAIILFAMAVIISGALWGQNLRRLAGKAVISNLEAIRVHTGAWLLKYVPGQAGSIIYKLMWGKENKVPSVHVVLSFIYENLFLTFASTIPTIPIILLSIGDSSGSYLLLMLIGLLSLPILFSSSLINALVEKLVKKYTKKTHSLNLLSFAQLLYMTALYVIPRMINAIGFLIIAGSFLTINSEIYLPLAAIYVLAGIVGIYAIFVPSGLGVREAVIVVLASAYFLPEEAIILSLIARFYATLADGLLGLIFVYMTKEKWNRKR